MDTLLLIFALQLLVLFLCLTFSIESSKIQSTLSLQNLNRLLAMMTGKEQTQDLDLLNVELSNFDMQEHSSNDKGVVYLDSQRQNDCQSDRMDKDEVGRDEFDCEKSNFNEFSGYRSCSLLAFYFFVFISRTLKALKSVPLRFGKQQHYQQKAHKSFSHQISAAVSSNQHGYSPTHRCVSVLEAMSSQIKSSRIRSKRLRYNNKELPAAILTHLKAKLTKLNFLIYKKKKTRPLSIIYELQEEML